MFWIYVFHSLTRIWIYPFYDPKIIPNSMIIIINVIVGVSYLLSYFIVKLLIWLRLIFFGMLKKKFKKFLWKSEAELPQEFPSETTNENENENLL